MATERAVHGHEAVARELRARVPRSRPRDRLAADTGGQPQLAPQIGTGRETAARILVLVQDAAEPHVGHPGGADPAEARERKAVAAHLEQYVHPVASALEWGAVVRRPDADQFSQLAAPGVVLGLARVARAPRDQAAHAVPDDRQLANGH